MRILHTADWHLGRRLFDLDRHDAARQVIDWLVEVVRDREIDLVIVAGDVYDRSIPPLESVAVLDEALAGLAATGTQVLLISGNHDNPVRLGFGSALAERAGVHWRTTVEDVDRPIVLDDGHGSVAAYGIPYLYPDAVCTELGADRSHAAVLKAAMDRVRTDAAARGIARYVVAAHALVTGGATSDSERDISVGGVSDVPSAVFTGARYVALGHLHGQQTLPAPPGSVIAYSGSPLAMSFSERNHVKGVTIVDLDDAGVQLEHMAAPVDRPLVEVRGSFDELQERAAGDLAHLADAFVKVVLTDRLRPIGAMAALRTYWPHTLLMDNRHPEVAESSATAVAARAAIDPTSICAEFIEHVSGTAPSDFERFVLDQAVESARVAS